LSGGLVSEAPSIVEEHADNQATGVEVETTESEQRLTEPWDPGLIRVDPKTFSLRQIMDMIDDHELDLAPDFQRHRVWKPVQKARLIESILLRIPLPAFYFSSDGEGLMQVVDGLQRLSTIHGFMKDAFPLEALEYLEKQLGGHTYSQIKETLWGRRLQTTQIFVNVIDPQTPSKVKFDIFKRINTGGEPLNSQEIRHCMSRAPSRAYLAQCAGLPAFRKATGGALEDHRRMADRECALRFTAFYRLSSLDDYAQYESMDVFLTDATEQLDRLGEDAHAAQVRTLQAAMESAFELFGDHAFRKWPSGLDRLNPINKALFEAWSVNLARRRWAEVEPRKAAIVEAARNAMRDDREFNDAISVATGDPRKVKLRFAVVRDLLDRAGTTEAPRSGAELVRADFT